MQKMTVALAIILGALAGYGGSFANAGHNGKQGSVGITGKIGPQGKPGQSAVVADLGVCLTVTTDPTDSWVTSVGLAPPELINGVRSCYSGNFVSVVPTPPTGYTP
jgi:hypothetical protein